MALNLSAVLHRRWLKKQEMKEMSPWFAGAGVKLRQGKFASGGPLKALFREF